MYERTRRLATGNAWVQGLSGMFGGGTNLLVDAAAVPFYADLWTDIRAVYGRGRITGKAATEYLKPNLPFLAQDLLWDKVVGSIPVIGIPFNIAFGKALTWRLGAWFGLLSAAGGDGEHSEAVTRASIELVRQIFPSVGDVFSFAAPDREVFIAFISSVDGLSPGDFATRTQAAIDALKGGAPPPGDGTG